MQICCHRWNLCHFIFIVSFRLASNTWQQLELISGGSLSETVKVLSSLRGEKLATEEHFRAIERRLLKIYATVQYCIGKHGSAKVFKSIY